MSVIDFGGCVSWNFPVNWFWGLLIGIVGTIDSGDGLLIGIARTIDRINTLMKWDCPDNLSQRFFIY